MTRNNRLRTENIIEKREIIVKNEGFSKEIYRKTALYK